jgi:hypothetical protein
VILPVLDEKRRDTVLAPFRHSTLGYRSPDRFEEEMIRKEPQTAVAVSS